MKGSRVKKRIRKWLLSKRDGLGEDEILAKSRFIRERVLGLEEFRKAKRILTYIEKGTEVKTSIIIPDMFSFGKEVILPIVEGDGLVLSRIIDLSELGMGAFGILEPRIRRIVDPSSLELAILPGVGFDLNGNRIGYGGGYFDRLLKGIDIPVIGLAYEIQIVDSLPSSRWDLKVHKIITEKRIIDTYMLPVS